MTDLHRHTTLRIAFALALAIIFLLALTPTPDTAQVIEQQDKFGHFFVFLLLGLLGLAAWPQRPYTVIVALLSYGLLMELAQSLTDHRHGDPWDWIADALGVASAWLIARLRAKVRMR